MKYKKISIIIPSYNEEKSVFLMYNRIKSIFDNELSNYNYEIIFVDDYSKDNTRVEIEQLCKKDLKVKAVFNAKNFGFHRNIFSALSYGDGDATFLLFGDLQDPPEKIIDFVKEWEKGYKVIVGQRSKSEEGFIITLFRKTYYNVVNALSNKKQIMMFNGFGLYDKVFIDILSEIDDVQPFFKYIVAEYGMDLKIIQYEQAKSVREKSNFNFFSNFDVAMQGITSSTKLLMRVAIFISVFIGVISLSFTLFVFVHKLLNWNTYPAGTASIIIGIFLMGSLTLFFIGILGEYILSINDRIVRKPRVIVARKINFVDKNEEQ